MLGGTCHCHHQFILPSSLLTSLTQDTWPPCTWIQEYPHNFHFQTHLCHPCLVFLLFHHKTGATRKKWTKEHARSSSVLKSRIRRHSTQWSFQLSSSITWTSSDSLGRSYYMLHCHLSPELPCPRVVTRHHNHIGPIQARPECYKSLWTSEVLSRMPSQYLGRLSV